MYHFEVAHMFTPEIVGDVRFVRVRYYVEIAFSRAARPSRSSSETWRCLTSEIIFFHVLNEVPCLFQVRCTWWTSALFVKCGSLIHNSVKIA